MKEKLFNEIVLKDLQKVNELVSKGWFETTDFNDAVLALSNSLSAYHQEVNYESCKEGEYLQKSWLVQGA